MSQLSEWGRFILRFNFSIILLVKQRKADGEKGRQNWGTGESEDSGYKKRKTVNLLAAIKRPLRQKQFWFGDPNPDILENDYCPILTEKSFFSSCVVVVTLEAADTC